MVLVGNHTADMATVGNVKGNRAVIEILSWLN